MERLVYKVSEKQQFEKLCIPKMYCAYYLTKLSDGPYNQPAARIIPSISCTRNNITVLAMRTRVCSSATAQSHRSSVCGKDKNLFYKALRPALGSAQSSMQWVLIVCVCVYVGGGAGVRRSRRTS
jgi:hypothetical protein